ncbi:MAG: tRNA pseudouridine(38-40) synthase TruA [Bacteroidia bacterium]|nr:tRNA pseudouridine(38-40) synthase TruA [Bacteroidia bacterium]
MPKYFIELSYCGTHYHGWQIQSNTDRTIQKILSDILSVTLKHPVSLVGCGRTDTGVHVKQFFAHFESNTLCHYSSDYWIHKWNSMLPNDIAIHNILQVKDSAHARYSAISRTYEYHIHQKKNPFLFSYSWFFPHSLHHPIIHEALTYIIHHTDFACFTKHADEYKDTQCIIYNAEWKSSSEQIVFTITANRFLRNMIRAMVGTLIELGTNKISLKEFNQILLLKDRKNAGMSAPPQGLHLTKIEYPSDIFII